MVQAVQWVGSEVNRGENFTCPIPFFSKLAYEVGAAIASRCDITQPTSEEILNGQGHDTEESNQEKTSQDGEGKARRQACQEEGLMQPALRLF